MASPEKYIPLDISRKNNYSLWLTMRQTCLTSTDATKLLTKNFNPEVIIKNKTSERQNNYQTKYMEFGVKREPEILKIMSELFPFTPNDMILQNRSYENFVATPDAIHEDYTVEVKSSINSLNDNIKKYYPQIQWQMFVTGKNKSLFIVEQHSNFNPTKVEYAWIKYDSFVETIFTERGKQVISLLQSKSTIKMARHEPKLDSIFDEKILTHNSCKDTKDDTTDEMQW
jgi:hypothetical protein